MQATSRAETSHGREPGSLFITVLVPTYRRPEALERCLVALARQERPADAVIVIRRDGDDETRTVLDACTDLPLQSVVVNGVGIVAALNAGLDSARGDIVALTDDDAAPHPDWLARIEAHYIRRPDLGGVGGRDYVAGCGDEPEQDRVGILQWFGRHIGNHHVGTGPARDVDLLKGVNMTFRLQALDGARFDERLRGTGAQVFNELAFCLALRKKGWHLLYDPAIAVDHFPAQRFDEDQRSSVSLLALRNAAYNETLSKLEHFDLPGKLAFLLWAFAIGDRYLPGCLQCIRLALGGENVWYRLPAVFSGRFEALRMFLFTR